jgi:hypothetical protein
MHWMDRWMHWMDGWMMRCGRAWITYSESGCDCLNVLAHTHLTEKWACCFCYCLLWCYHYLRHRRHPQAALALTLGRALLAARSTHSNSSTYSQ